MNYLPELKFGHCHSKKWSVFNQLSLGVDAEIKNRLFSEYPSKIVDDNPLNRVDSHPLGL